MNKNVKLIEIHIYAYIPIHSRELIMSAIDKGIETAKISHPDHLPKICTHFESPTERGLWNEAGYYMYGQLCVEFQKIYKNLDLNYRNIEPPKEMQSLVRRLLGDIHIPTAADYVHTVKRQTQHLKLTPVATHQIFPPEDRSYRKDEICTIYTCQDGQYHIKLFAESGFFF